MKLTSVFTNALQINIQKLQIGKRNNSKIRVEGDVITADEFLEMLEKQQTEKKSRKRTQKLHVVENQGTKNYDLVTLIII